jgi:hypothetical protein
MAANLIYFLRNFIMTLSQALNYARSVHHQYHGQTVARIAHWALRTERHLSRADVKNNVYSFKEWAQSADAGTVSFHQNKLVIKDSAQQARIRTKGNEWRYSFT